MYRCSVSISSPITISLRSEEGGREGGREGRREGGREGVCDCTLYVCPGA